MSNIIGMPSRQEERWRMRPQPQPTPQELQQLAQLAGRDLPPTTVQQPPPQGPPPQMPPQPYEYPPLTEAQQSRAKWMGPIQFLTGAFNKNPGSALMGAMTGREDYESGALYDNYLDKRLDDPTLTKIQRDALYARRHKDESFSSTYGPFNSYSTASSRGVRTPRQIGNNRVQDEMRFPDPSKNYDYGLPYDRNADAGVKKATAKDVSHYTDIQNARRKILALDPKTRKEQLEAVATGFADQVMAKLYALASSSGHPGLDNGLSDYMQQVYGDLKPWQQGDAGSLSDKYEVVGPSAVGEAWGAVKGAVGGLYDNMTATDPMAPTQDEDSLRSLERSIRENDERRGY